MKVEVGNIPPEDLMSQIGVSTPVVFRNLGIWNVDLLRIAGLKADDSVLDIGCGCGRITNALEPWHTGKYVGTDINPKMIEYCKNTYPNREFYQTEEFVRFNYPDNSFDFIVMHSVVTHTRKEVTEQYLKEIGRLLKKKAFLTCFLSEEHFFWRGTGYYHPKKWMDEKIAENGMKSVYLKGVNHDGYGFWSHDIYILEK